MQRPFKNPQMNEDYYLANGGIQVLDGVSGTQKDIKAATDKDPEPAEEAMSLKAHPALIVGINSSTSGNKFVGINSFQDIGGTNRLGVATENFGISKSQTTLNVAASRTDTYTVPAGKKWLLHFAGFDRPNAATCRYNLTLSGVTFNYDSNAVAATAGKSSFQFILNAADSVIIDCAVAAAGNILTYIIYDEITI